MQIVVLRADLEAKVSAFIVWVPTLTSDTLEAAETVTDVLADPRVTHFYDGRRHVSRTVADRLGGNGALAWDCYLFYHAGAVWEDVLPLPDWWMHQLGPSAWADPARFRWQDSLTDELRRAAASLLKTRGEP